MSYCPPAPCPPFPPYPPFPANPTVGQRFGSWVWNGSSWVVSPSQGVTVTTQTFLASGTYTPSPGLVTAIVTCYGGGGAGGAAGPAPTNLYILGGGGGGSGGQSRKTLAGALLIGGVAVTIGAGGVPTDTDVAGGNGGTTSFGAFCIALGGTGGGYNGVGGPTNQWGEGGAGAFPGTGDLALAGNDGFNGPYIVLTTAQNNAYSGGRGGSILGGARNYSWGPNQIPGGQASWANSGAGGSGAMLNQLATGAISEGGAGGSGICWVDEYCALPASSWPGSGCAPGAPVTTTGCGPGWGDFDCGPYVMPVPGR